MATYNTPYIPTEWIVVGQSNGNFISPTETGIAVMSKPDRLKRKRDNHWAIDMPGPLSAPLITFTDLDAILQSRTVDPFQPDDMDDVAGLTDVMDEDVAPPPAKNLRPRRERAFWRRVWESAMRMFRRFNTSPGS